MGQEVTKSSIIALAERWNGSKWAVQDTHVSGSPPSLDEVSCPSATNCTAAGFRPPPGNGTTVTLAEHWDGTTWTTQTTPSPGSTDNELYGITCTATHCVAVGYAASGENFKPLVEAS